MTLLQNALFIKESDFYLVSTEVDDLNSFAFDDGLILSVAGGTEFARRDGDFIKLSTQDRYEEWCLTDADPFYWIAERLLAQIDTSGDDWRPIKDQDVTTLHLLSSITSHPLRARVAAHWLKVKALTAV